MLEPSSLSKSRSSSPALHSLHRSGSPGNSRSSARRRSASGALRTRTGSNVRSGTLAAQPVGCAGRARGAAPVASRSASG